MCRFPRSMCASIRRRNSRSGTPPVCQPPSNRTTRERYDSAPPLASLADVCSVHLHHVQAVPGPPSRQEGARGHLAQLPAGGQDRRARAQRLGQVHAAADHGRAATPTFAATPSSRRAPRSGCSSRSLSSTRPRTWRATSRTACGELRALLDRFNELAADYSDETADEFARLQDAIDAADAWNLDTHARDRHGRAASAARRRRRRRTCPAASAAAWRCAACC